jgi:hypothetical protein
MKNLNLKKVLFLTMVLVLAMSMTAFATTTPPTVSEQVSSGITDMVAQLTQTIAVVAPSALAIVGLTLAWKYAIKFLKSLASK